MSTTTTMIAIRCACGRQGHINAALAGRAVRCTGCGGKVRVPAHTPPTPAPAWAPPPDLSWAPPPAPAAAPPALDLLPAVERPAVAWEVRRGVRRPEPDDAQDRGPRRPRRPGSGDAHRRDLPYEAHLRAISFWQLLSGAVGVVFALVLTLLTIGAAPTTALGLGLAQGSVSVLVGALGWALWSYYGAGRLLYLLFGALAMVGHLLQLHHAPGAMKLVVLVAMGWTGAILVVVASARAAYICTPEYRALVARTARQATVRWWASPFFFVPVVLMVITLAAALVMVGAAMSALAF